MDFDATDQLPITYSTLIKYLITNGNTMKQCISKKAYNSVRREVLYNILTEYGIVMKLVRLIKMCLIETYSRVWVDKHLSDIFPIKNGLNIEMLYRQSFSNFL